MEQQPQPQPQQPQPRNSSAATFAAMLAQNIVVLLEELDQLKAELAKLRAEVHHDLDGHTPDRPGMRINGGASA